MSDLAVSPDLVRSVLPQVPGGADAARLRQVPSASPPLNGPSVERPSNIGFIICARKEASNASAVSRIRAVGAAAGGADGAGWSRAGETDRSLILTSPRFRPAARPPP